MNAVADKLQAAEASEDTLGAPLLAGSLDIISGTQQGASARLHPGTLLTVGSSLDNDIVVRDPSVERQHFTLTLGSGDIQLQCLSGSILVDGMPVLAGDSAAASASVIVQAGSVAFSINCPGIDSDSDSDSDYMQASPASAALADENTVADPHLSGPSLLMPQHDDLPAVSDDTVYEELKDTKTASASKSGFLTVSALFLGAIVVWQSGLFKSVTEEPTSLSSLLAMSPFTELVVEQVGSSATVSGYVDTVHESMELSQWLDQSGLSVKNEVRVSDTLAEQVSDVFRVNGVIAEVEVINGEEVLALTREADLSLLETIEKRVMADVPLVASLQIDNKPPPVEPIQDPTITTDPGKRVSLVVSDEPAYIVTQDQSRYFIGSILPTGHRVAAIKDGKVSLEKMGETTTLEF